MEYALFNMLYWISSFSISIPKSAYENIPISFKQEPTAITLLFPGKDFLMIFIRWAFWNYDKL